MILQPEVEFMNVTKVKELSGENVLPRLKVGIKVKGDLTGTGWFMDLNAERESHLGTIGGGESPGHRNVYVHSSY